MKKNNFNNIIKKIISALLIATIFLTGNGINTLAWNSNPGGGHSSPGTASSPVNEYANVTGNGGQNTIVNVDNSLQYAYDDYATGLRIYAIDAFGAGGSSGGTQLLTSIYGTECVDLLGPNAAGASGAVKIKFANGGSSATTTNVPFSSFFGTFYTDIMPIHYCHGYSSGKGSIASGHNNSARTKRFLNADISTFSIGYKSKAVDESGTPLSDLYDTNASDLLLYFYDDAVANALNDGLEHEIFLRLII